MVEYYIELGSSCHSVREEKYFAEVQYVSNFLGCLVGKNSLVFEKKAGEESC